MSLMLTKDHPVTELPIKDEVLSVTLEWNSRTDVDLACLYETSSGQTGCVQALGSTFGSLDEPPFVALDRDDRAGGMETMRFRLGRAREVRRLLFFAYIYQGGNWKKVGDARVVITNPGEPDIVMQLEGARARTCSLVDVVPVGNSLQVTRLGDYFHGTHKDVDRHYGWPRINWVQSSKD